MVVGFFIDVNVISFKKGGLICIKLGEVFKYLVRLM